MPSLLSHNQPQQGFSLLEILAVLGIMAVVAGIAWAGLLGNQRSTGLLAAADLTADIIRQARATALSTGAPVQLKFDSTTNTITGVSQQPIFHVDFDTYLAPGTTTPKIPVPDEQIPNALDPSSPFRHNAHPGVAGYGLVIGYPGIEDPDFDMQPNPVPGDPTQDPGDSPDLQGYYIFSMQDQPPLMRKDGDGWWVECWFKAPPFTKDNNIGDELAPANGGIDFLPILRIGTSDDFQSPGAFICLDLIPYEYDIQVQPVEDPTDPDYPEITITEWRWTLEARVNDGGTAFILNDDVTQDNYHPSVTLNEPKIPRTGGKWEHLGIHYDGEELHLYRNHINVNSVVVSPIISSPSKATFENFKLYVGTDQSNGDPTRDGNYHEGGIIDEVRIMRLGNDRPAKLPSGVKIDTSANITISSGSSGLASSRGPQDVTLVSNTDTTADGQPREAKLSISASGRVTTEISK